MRTIIRKQNWYDGEGGRLNRAYEISTDANNVYLAMLTCQQGCYDGEVKLPIPMLDGLLEAYDNDCMDEWMNDNAETLYHAEKTYMEAVR